MTTTERPKYSLTRRVLEDTYDGEPVYGWTITGTYHELPDTFTPDGHGGGTYAAPSLTNLFAWASARLAEEGAPGAAWVPRTDEAGTYYIPSKVPHDPEVRPVHGSPDALDAQDIEDLMAAVTALAAQGDDRRTPEGYRDLRRKLEALAEDVFEEIGDGDGE